MIKIFILLFLFYSTIFAKQDILQGYKKQSSEKIVKLILIQNAIEDNASIASSILDTFSDCYVTNMQKVNIDDFNGTGIQKTNNLIVYASNTEFNCLNVILDKYSIGSKIDVDFKKQLSEIIRKHLVYPDIAKKMHEEGLVIVQILLLKNGMIFGSQIIQSSNSAILDRNALQTVKNASVNFPKPSRNLIIQIPIIYKFGQVWSSPIDNPTFK